VADEPLIDERFQQAVGGSDGKAAGLTQLADTDLAASPDHLFEKAQRALDSLDSIAVPSWLAGILRGLSPFCHTDNRIQTGAS